jgi:cytoskeletal protein CcmA (bactofilin family)
MKIKPIKQEEAEMDVKMNTIIGKDSVITGTIDIKGPLRIDGKVKGQIISSDTVTVGAEGHLEAEIKCRNATIAGRVDGNVIASEKVELQAKAEIAGDLKTKSLVIEQGAIFCGSCNMKEGMAEPGVKKYTEVADKVRKEQAQPTTKSNL